MVDLRPFMPVEGGQLCTMLGGPFDKLAIHFDFPLPKTLIIDGHRYDLEFSIFPILLDPSLEWRVRRVMHYEEDSIQFDDDIEQYEVYYRYILLRRNSDDQNDGTGDGQ